MLHIENEYIREHLLDGAFGIEMESLRVVGDGTDCTSFSGRCTYRQRLQ